MAFSRNTHGSLLDSDGYNKRLLKALEAASHDLNQSEISVTDIETEIENLEVRCMLRRVEIQQEFTSFIDLLIQCKASVLNSLEKEAQHRKQYLEGLLEKHKAMQRQEGRLTDKVTTLVQNSEESDLLSYLRLKSKCEKFSRKVKSSFTVEDSSVTSFLDNPFSLYKEKKQLDSAATRDSINHGDIKCIRNTLQMNPANELNLEDVIKLPQFPTSSSQTYHVELVKFPRTKLWETTTTSLKDLNINSATTYRLEPNETYILHVKVCISIEISALTKVEKEGKSTHMMIIMTDCPMDLTDPVPQKETLSSRLFSSEEERYHCMILKENLPPITNYHAPVNPIASVEGAFKTMAAAQEEDTDTDHPDSDDTAADSDEAVTSEAKGQNIASCIPDSDDTATDSDDAVIKEAKKKDDSCYDEQAAAGSDKTVLEPSQKSRSS